MRRTGIFFLYLLGCLVLGALLTYPVYQTGWIEAHPHKVMTRLAQLFILLGIWPLLRAMHLNHARALGYGLPWPGLRRALVLGWLAGVALLSVPALTVIALGIRVPAPVPPDFWGVLVEEAVLALFSGLLIAVVEETFFRGALFSAVRRGGTLSSALFWSALLYAVIHFLKPHVLAPGQTFDAAASWQMFLGVFTSFFQWRHIDSLFALFVAGLLLGLVRERTGHIGWCIGLHAGWVFVIKLTRHLTDGNPDSAYAFLVGSYDGTIGWLAAAWMAAMLLLLWRWPRTP
jgi:membrane protease YdiL (CAAX protease family)